MNLNHRTPSKILKTPLPTLIGDEQRSTPLEMIQDNCSHHLVGIELSLHDEGLHEVVVGVGHAKYHPAEPCSQDPAIQGEYDTEEEECLSDLNYQEENPSDLNEPYMRCK